MGNLEGMIFCVRYCYVCGKMRGQYFQEKKQRYLEWEELSVDVFKEYEIGVVFIEFK